MYMLNLLFDTTSTNGLFVDYSTANSNLLARSKTWLTTPGDPPANFNPLTASWTDLGGDATLSVSKSASPLIAVRIASVNPISSNTTLRLSVVFGRKHKNQAFASPFTLDNTPGGASCAVFDSSFDVAQLTDGSWYYALRPIAIGPPNSGLTYRFEFLVGISLNSGQSTFGHDPEMDVQM